MDASSTGWGLYATEIRLYSSTRPPYNTVDHVVHPTPAIDPGLMNRAFWGTLLAWHDDYNALSSAAARYTRGFDNA